MFRPSVFGDNEFDKFLIDLSKLYKAIEDLCEVSTKGCSIYRE